MPKRKPADPVKVQQDLINRIREEIEGTAFADIPAARLTAFATILKNAAPAIEKKASDKKRAEAVAKASGRLPSFPDEDDDDADSLTELPRALGEACKTPRDLLGFVAPSITTTETTEKEPK